MSDRPLLRVSPASRHLVWLVAMILVACGPVPPPTVSGSAPVSEPTAIASEGSSGLSMDPALVGAATGRDPLFPTLGNGGYDVRSYQIDVVTNPVDNLSTIRVVIEAVASQRLGQFSLDYAGIAAASVSVDGTPAAFTEVGGKLAVTPPRLIEPATTFRTAVEIAGRPAAVRGDGWAWRGPDQLSAFGIYDLLPLWLPINDDPADKALIETRITVPHPYTAVGPGSLISATEVGAGRRFEWHAGPSSQVSIVVRDYEVADLGTVAGIPLTSYAPGDLPPRQREVLDSIPVIFEYLGTLYGPYPFESLNLVWIEGLSDVEGPDEGLLKWGPERSEATALAHHLTHIWFAVNATPRTSRESYLRAAFANYGDLLWIEHAEGAAARDDRIAQMHAALGTRTDPPAEPSRVAANPALFSRGPLSLHALRVIVGDAAFFDILQTWVVRFHRQAASVEDFVTLAQDVSGRSLEEWRQRWLFDETVPPLSELAVG